MYYLKIVFILPRSIVKTTNKKYLRFLVTSYTVYSISGDQVESAY
jgi:hypothetical protein